MGEHDLFLWPRVPLHQRLRNAFPGRYILYIIWWFDFYPFPDRCLRGTRALGTRLANAGEDYFARGEPTRSCVRLTMRNEGPLVFYSLLKINSEVFEFQFPFYFGTRFRIWGLSSCFRFFFFCIFKKVLLIPSFFQKEQQAIPPPLYKHPFHQVSLNKIFLSLYKGYMLTFWNVQWNILVKG